VSRAQAKDPAPTQRQVLTDRVLAVAYVINHMWDHLDEPLTVDDLVGVASYSKFHLSRIFQETMGLPPIRYLAVLRIERAKWLLENTDYVVAAIGPMVGYQSVGSFGTLFKKRVGESLSAYRRLSCSGQPPEPSG